MAEEQGQERTEKATSKRREDFRKKGQVAQSREVQTAALMIAFVMLWNSYGPTFFETLSQLLAHIWSISGGFTLSPASTVTLFGFLLGRLRF